MGGGAADRESGGWGERGGGGSGVQWCALPISGIDPARGGSPRPRRPGGRDGAGQPPRPPRRWGGGRQTGRAAGGERGGVAGVAFSGVLFRSLGLIRREEERRAPADRVAAMALDSLRARLADGVAVG